MGCDVRWLIGRHNELWVIIQKTRRFGVGFLAQKMGSFGFLAFRAIDQSLSQLRKMQLGSFRTVLYVFVGLHLPGFGFGQTLGFAWNGEDVGFG